MLHSTRSKHVYQPSVIIWQIKFETVSSIRLMISFLLRLTPCKVEQPLRGMDLQEKEEKQ